MERITDVLEFIVRYLLTIKITDLLDIAVMGFVIFKLLQLVKSTRAVNLLKGVFIFLMALWLSDIAEFHGVNFILSHMAVSYTHLDVYKRQDLY